jgi:hypothetical protein
MNQSKPLAIERMAIELRAQVQPKLVAIYAVAIGATNPPRPPNIFIRPEREAA